MNGCAAMRDEKNKEPTSGSELSSCMSGYEVAGLARYATFILLCFKFFRRPLAVIF